MSALVSLVVWTINVFSLTLKGERKFYVAGRTGTTEGSPWYAHTTRFATESEARLFASKVRGRLRLGRSINPALWEHAECDQHPFPADMDPRVDGTPITNVAEATGVAKVAPAPVTPPATAGNCPRCGGSGTYRWGPTVNGQPSRSGQCFACRGKGSIAQRVASALAASAAGAPPATVNLPVEQERCPETRRDWPGDAHDFVDDMSA